MQSNIVQTVIELNLQNFKKLFNLQQLLVYPFLNRMDFKSQESNIDKIDQFIRKNNKKYLQQKNDLQYKNALKQFENQRKRQLMKQYAISIKQGNRKAIERKKLQRDNHKNHKHINKTSSTINKPVRTQQGNKLAEKKQKMSEKQIEKTKKTIQTRAQRYLQQMQLNKLNKQLEQERKKTKLYQLNQKCQKLLSKSHKRIPQISEHIPQQRRVILKQFTRKAQQQVKQLDNIMSGLLKRSKKVKEQKIQYNICTQNQIKKTNFQKNKIHQNFYQQKSQDMDIFSKQFQKQFNLAYNQEIDNRFKKIQDKNTLKNSVKKDKEQTNFLDNLDHEILFTKSATELLQMDYIPIQ